ncbi:MAG: sulfotransferase, partial [Alphaproteobacteria bacterium]|nr:sulfotransferase [Alphaproteobacteria bacterium]
TTLVGKLLDSHPDVLYRHEPDSVLVDPDIPFLPSAGRRALHVAAARLYLAALTRVRAPKVAARPPVFAKSWRRPAAALAHRAMARAAPLLAPLKALPVADLIDPALRDTVVPAIKSVNSLCRTRLFHEAWPEARIVHVVRHPCAVVASRLAGIGKGLMRPNVYLAATFAMDEARRYPFGEEEMRQRPLEQQMAYQWMVHNDKVHAETRGLEACLTLRHETLCRGLTQGARALFAHCRLDWNAQTATFVARLESLGGDGGARYFSIMRNPAAELERWRERLSPAQIHGLAGVLAHSTLCREAYPELLGLERAASSP